MSLLTVAPSVAAFDPDAYLNEKAAGPAPFDPDAYLREKRISNMAAETGHGKSLERGAAQGVSMGHGDEMAAGYGASQKVYDRMPELRGVPDSDLYALQMADPSEYRAQRDAFREQDQAAHRAHPGVYTAGEIAGAAIPSLAATMGTGGAGALPSSVLQGAVQGAGYSNAEDARGVVRDSVIGGGVGAIGHTVGQEASSLLRGVAGLAKSKAAAAAGRAGTQAAEEANAGLATLTSKYGGEAQKGHRLVENLARLEASMTPQQRALYAQLEQSGALQSLREQLAGHALEAAPTQVSTIAQRKAAMEAAQQALPQTIASRTAELSKPQILKDAASFAKAYGEPAIAAAVAPVGLKLPAAVLFGRTRAGKALMSRINRPGNQIALWNAVQKTAEMPDSGGEVVTLLRQALQQAARSPAADYAVNQ